MLKRLIYIFTLLVLFSFKITNAQNYTCTSHDLYHKPVFSMTNSDDVYRCENYWMQGNTIKTEWWNDKVYISKQTPSHSLKIYLWDGNDIFYHTFHNVQLRNTLIDGGNGFDTVVIKNAKKDDFEINGDCKQTCTIKHKKLWFLFKDVVLKNIEKIVFDDTSIIFDWNWWWDENNWDNDNWNSNNWNDNSDNQQDNNQNNSNQWNNAWNQNYDKIILSSYKYLIPTYFWSLDLSEKILKLPTKSTIIIVNPANGDFSKTQSNFQKQIENAHKNQNLAIWYIYSKYGNRSWEIVKQKIDNWLKYYPNINWIFVDEVSSSASKLDYYKRIYNYIKSKNKNLIVVLNPWTTPDKWYFNIADNIVAYENPCNSYNSYSKPSWLNNYKNYQISYLWYSCSDSQKKDLYQKYWNHLTYFTYDGKDGNPWDSLDLSMLDNQNNWWWDENNGNDNNWSDDTDDSWYTKWDFTYSKKNKFSNFLVYYGYPNYINEAQHIHLSDKKEELKKRLQVAVKEFSKFKAVIWSSRLPNPAHKAHNATKELLKLLKWNVISYGYIALYGWYRWKATPQSVCRDVKEWSTMWIDGIFFDEASFNYYKKSNNNFKDYQNYIRTVYKCAKKYWYKVIFNTWNSKDIIEAIPNLTEDDGFMIEDFYYANGQKKQSYIERVNRNKAVMNKTKAKYFCLATWRWLSNQEEVNRIGKELKNEMMSICDYRSVQDATYWTESKITYASDDILDGSEYKKDNWWDDVDNDTSWNWGDVDNKDGWELDSILGELQDKNNIWKEKIQKLTMPNKTYHNSKLNKYYPLFVKFFNIKKKNILANLYYMNSRNYNNLNFFSHYTLWLFTDLDNKEYKNIKSYIWMLKKVIISLKKIR